MVNSTTMIALNNITTVRRKTGDSNTHRTFSYSIGHIEQVTDATKRGNIDYQPTFLLNHHLCGIYRTYIVVPEKEINL